MRLNLFKQPKTAEEHIDIHYAELTPRLQYIITVIEDSMPRLEGRRDGEIFLLNPNDIYYVDTVDRNTFLYIEKDVYYTVMTLSGFINLFAVQGFARVNKSQIVNLRRIRRIRPTAGMRILAVLDNGEQLVINRGYRDSFEEALLVLGRKPHEKMD